jgi:integrase
MGGTGESGVKYLDDLDCIEIRGDSIRIKFSYKGEQRRHTLKGKKVSKASIEFAKKKLAVINLQIAEGTFNYAEHFPGSKQAQKFQHKSINRTIAEGGTKYLALQENKLAPSGLRTYTNKYNKHILPQWGDRKIREVLKSDLEQWQLVTLPDQDLSEKTINMIFTVMRGIFDAAFSDGIIASNPFDRISNLTVPDDQEPDPFTREELAAILALEDMQQEVNATGFNAHAGMREGELLGLAWEDIDTKKWVVRVQRGRVANEYRVPKTKGSVREIYLTPEAIFYLKRQMAHTYALPAAMVDVRQKNARKLAQEELRFVFHSTATGRPWSGDTVFRKTFARLLRKAGVRYRPPNQLRHTYCSWLLTNNVPPEWIAPMMGTSVAMIRKHYGTFISDDRPNMGAAIAHLMGQQSAAIDGGGKLSSEFSPKLAQETTKKL